jgi:hypothetical protein
MPEAAKLRVGFLLMHNFTLTAFASFVDVLRLAADEGDRSRPIDCTWQVMSSNRHQVRMPKRDTMISTRGLTLQSRNCQVISNFSEIAVKSDFRTACEGPFSAENATRMKNVCVERSEDWALSRMLQPCSTGNLDTACTMPMRSSQWSVSTKSGLGAEPDANRAAVGDDCRFRADVAN